jgi:hypothetical protein
VFFKTNRDGTVAVQLDPVVREIVGNVCRELRDTLAETTDEPALRRLYPPAYRDDPERQRAYAAISRDELTTSRVAALDTVIDTIGEDQIDAVQAEQWMFALNAVRLTLGTLLDITEDHDPRDVDEDDPRLPQLVTYDLLSLLLGSLVTTIAR